MIESKFDLRMCRQIWGGEGGMQPSFDDDCVYNHLYETDFINEELFFLGSDKLYFKSEVSLIYNN